MKKLLILALLLGSLYTAKAQTSGWVMDLGDGVYYWNSWENSRSSNVKGNSEANDTYEKTVLEGKLEYERMVGRTEGIEGMLRECAWQKKVLDNDALERNLAEVGFKLDKKDENVLRFKHKKRDHFIHITKAYVAGKSVIAVSLTTLSGEIFVELFTDFVRESSSQELLDQSSLDPIYVLYGEESADKTITVQEYSFKDRTFAFENKKKDFFTLGVIYTY